MTACLAPNPTSSTGSTVLVVDDDPTIRFFHRLVLERAGHTVVPVACGDDAIAAMAEHDIEAVLLDSMMPGMSGIEVLSHLRGQSESLPVILVTGAAEMEDRITGLNLGADDYLTKPVDPGELLARVAAVIRGRQAARADISDVDEEHDRMWDRTASCIADQSFHPVFQPIVDLDDCSIVAYEGLTRFDDGRRPDIAFAEADAIGLGIELAVATLAASVEEASVLPAGISLHLNVSPGLLAHEPLVRLLARADRPIVVELTEHDRIEDYAEVIAHLAHLGDDIRLAVDDAGAGYASMAHILELRPDEVKLDREWVRGVDDDVARRALIAGVVSFAAATGTVLVAEGVETEAEARVLTELGVRHAQGYYFGHPERAGEAVSVV